MRIIEVSINITFISQV